MKYRIWKKVEGTAITTKKMSKIVTKTKKWLKGNLEIKITSMDIKL